MLDYIAYLKSPEWGARARQAKEAAGWRCQLCNRTVPLEVHHRSYDTIGREDERDVIALCYECHRRFHRSILLPPHDPQSSLPFESRQPDGADHN